MYITTLIQRIHKVDTSGKISTLAGTGTAGGTGDKGRATSAKLLDPRNCVLDSSGNVYVSDSGNYAVRVVTVSTKIITRYAGSGVGNYGGDGGLATSAKMNPFNIFMDSSGNLYSADYDVYRVRKIASSTKIITTYAGSAALNTLAGLGGPATSATIPGAVPYVVGDNLGTIFIGSSNRLFRVDGSTKIFTRYAGQSH
jgi:hypothetical protein